MNENNIRKYAELMKELDLTALEIKEDGSVRLERMPAPVMPPVQMQMAAPAVGRLIKVVLVVRVVFLIHQHYFATGAIKGSSFPSRARTNARTNALQALL